MSIEYDFGWLQISDIHIFASTDLNLMKREFDTIKKTYPIAFIIVTGDLHQYGEDYGKTLDFLNFLTNAFSLDVKDIFIVPGNHDAESFSVQKAILKDIDDNIEKNADYYLQYLDGSESSVLTKRFEKYTLFLDAFYGKTTSRQINVDIANWNDKINILSLNTALISSDDNLRRQAIDTWMLSNKYLKMDLQRPTIAIGHHPVESLCNSHQVVLKKVFDELSISAYYCGDLHIAAKNGIGCPSGKTIPQIICAKGIPDYSDDYSDIGCFVSCKIADSDQVEIIPCMWNKRNKGFFTAKMISTRNSSNCYSLQTPCTSPTENKQRESRTISTFSESESVWVPDAELADRKTARFRTYTSAQTLNNFMEKESKKCGLSAVKGVGKTFALQIKRSRYTDENLLCLPIQNRPNRDNEWGTESVEFSDHHIKHFSTFKRIVDIWKLSFITYTINQCVNYKYYLVRRTGRPLSEITYYSQNLDNRIQDLYNAGKLSARVYEICRNTDYEDLSSIILAILSEEEYLSANQIISDYDALSTLRVIIPKFLEEIKKSRIGIFVDKIDQSLYQSTSEPPSECISCHKQDSTTICTNPRKGSSFCAGGASCKINCCYGCDIFATPNLNQFLRLYRSESGPEFQHINLWQHLQLALVVAAYDIKKLFKSTVIVYYTVREEAFTCENALLGEHQKKILSLTQKLYYTKEEQHQIYLECIHNQADEYLFDPSLKQKPGMEEYAFLGIQRFCHPYVKGAIETVFDSIYRHSFDRARDIQEYGQVLTSHMDEIRDCRDEVRRSEKVKKIIEDYAATLTYSPIISGAEDVITNYYVEKHKFLPNHWANQMNFHNLIISFERNVLFYQDLVPICRKINDLKKCPKDCDLCKLHPFTMLYKLGLLGLLKYSKSHFDDVSQEFLSSREITYVRPTDVLHINRNTIYLLHPALTKSIEKLKGRNIMHFNGFIIGKDIPVSSTLIKRVLDDFKDLSQKAFREKYFCLPTDH